MIFDQGELLWGMDMLFIKKFQSISKNETHEGGAFLFREGDPATYFYTLIQGRVRLSLEKANTGVYVVDEAGEMFGWSSLVGREIYSATGECLDRTTLLKINRNELLKLLENNPENGFRFYKKMAEMLGNRIIQTYGIIQGKQDD